LGSRSWLADQQSPPDRTANTFRLSPFSTAQRMKILSATLGCVIAPCRGDGLLALHRMAIEHYQFVIESGHDYRRGCLTTTQRAQT
jgi:hypothetical protein